MTASIQLDNVDQQLFDCLTPAQPKSFFLYAGAGSGKTRSLVNVLNKVREVHAKRLLLAGQRVGVITYTNAACDEIRSRLGYDEFFSVSTIHSFAWALIKPYTRDIKAWLYTRLNEEVADLEDKQRRGRAGTKAAIDRPRQIDAKKKRLDSLTSVKKFIYSPDGNNTDRNSLNHAEVISITADFVQTRPLFRQIVVRIYPVLFIDESQDTNKELMDAFFQIQSEYYSVFSLGLFGDRMQRIYLDGKKDIGDRLPETWITPAKVINYRCPKRVISLINNIRAPLNDSAQEPGPNNEQGFARLFLANIHSDLNKTSFESWVSRKMVEITGDEGWKDDNHDNVKILTLEHLMAARRSGFDAFFKPLYAINTFKTGLLNGRLSGIALFSDQVLPVVDAMRQGNKFEVARIVRKYSRLLSEDVLKENDSQADQIKHANQAVNSLMNLWNDREPLLNEILINISRSGLFPIPDKLLPIAKRLDSNEAILTDSFESSEVDRDEEIDAWDEALKCTFGNFRGYVDYVSDRSRFGTHQGIKGREFPRVLVILDDNEAGGNQFQYEKLLGAKEPSDSDRKNESEGNETSTDRTRRLFYVTCSRAEKSLAVVAYTAEPERIKAFVVQQGWFAETEICFPPSDLVEEESA